MKEHVFIEHDDRKTVIGVYCSRECAPSDPYRIKRVPMPQRDNGLTGYALALLSCDGCGINLRDIHATLGEG